MKPDCEGCEEEPVHGLSSTVGKQASDDLVYGLFNPEGLQSDENNGPDLESLIQSYANKLSDADLEESVNEWLSASDDNWVYRNWMYESLRREKGKEEAWQDILERVRKGELPPSELPMKQLLQNFPRQISEALSEEGLIDLKVRKIPGQPKLHLGHVEFTAESERIIARRVLEEALINLEKIGQGLHELPETGFGTAPSSIVSEFDEYLHSYDLLDIQETLIPAAMRDPVNLVIRQEDLKARLPLHKARSSNVILLDISYSMYGNKFRGGIMAALALRQLFEEEFTDDNLYVIAYNDEPHVVLPGNLLKLRPEGNTDIGLALDLAVQFLSKEEGNRNIFLITDSEPTISCDRSQSAEDNAYRGAYLAGKEDIRLNLIMLDPKADLRRICDQMARLNGDAVVTYVDDPLNLKEFIIRPFANLRQMIRGG